MQDDTTRQPFADATQVGHDSRSGASEPAHTPLQIRSLEGSVPASLHAWIHERLGRQLGKFATQIERLEVRFSDENGRKGGIDHTCLIHVTLSSLPPLAVEARAVEQREAFDLAAGKTERALKHSLQKHGYTVGHKGRPRRDVQQTLSSDRPSGEAMAAETGEYPPSAAERIEVDRRDSLYGRREGRGSEALKAVHQRDAAEGAASHTAERNAKLNTEGMSRDLEDSLSGRPSRKSTRRGKNGVKADAALTLRARRRAHAPTNAAGRRNP